MWENPCGWTCEDVKLMRERNGGRNQSKIDSCICLCLLLGMCWCGSWSLLSDPYSPRYHSPRFSVTLSLTTCQYQTSDEPGQRAQIHAQNQFSTFKKVGGENAICYFSFPFFAPLLIPLALSIFSVLRSQNTNGNFRKFSYCMKKISLQNYKQ